MRKSPLITTQNEDSKRLQNAIEAIDRLAKRVQQLEAAVFDQDFPNAPEQTNKPNLGRRPKLPLETVLQRRDSLTTWLEQHWPILVGALRKAEETGNPLEALRAILHVKKSEMPGIQQAPFYDSPDAFLDDLSSFLASGRYHGNPRNLAGAMAGLPELKWKRSFDLCITHPSRRPLMPQAYRDYLRRKFPDRFRELLAATSVEKLLQSSAGRIRRTRFIASSSKSRPW